jgi:hypothetical protein
VRTFAAPRSDGKSGRPAVTSVALDDTGHWVVRSLLLGWLFLCLLLLTAVCVLECSMRARRRVIWLRSALRRVR